MLGVVLPVALLGDAEPTLVVKLKRELALVGTVVYVL